MDQRMFQKEPGPDLIRGGHRLSEMDMRHRNQLGRRPMLQTTTGVLIGLVLGLCIAAAAWLLFGGTLLIGPSERAEGLPIGSAKDFSDGIGIYYLNDGKYNFLYWKKKLLAPDGTADEKGIAEAAKTAIPVKKGVRFFSYGLDIAKWAAVPPYVMAFCTIRDMRSIEGIFPIRIKLIDSHEPIYELLLPPVIDNLGPGNTLWTVNFLYSCNDGWVFKFQ
jgi:hypothetical protein